MSENRKVADDQTYRLTFTTNEWEWDQDIRASGLEAARSAAAQALESVVQEEKPELAFVTLFQDGRKLGVLDWVQGQAAWSPAD